MQGVPVNVVAGRLGVGKTTAINHLLSLRPSTEKWAVLVNEYGLIGLDAALMRLDEDEDAVKVSEVAGGCICCSAGPTFEVTLVRLLRARPDRLIIEPTGLAKVSGILDTLLTPGIREAVDVRSVIGLMDASRLEHDVHREHVQDTIDAANVLLASRADLLSEDDWGRFEAWGRDLVPAKAHIGRIEQGSISLELLEHRFDPEASAVARDRRHRHGHHHHHHEDAAEPEPEAITVSAEQPFALRHHAADSASTLGWVCFNGWTFDAEKITPWLRELGRRPDILRVKGVLRTTEGWQSYNFSDGQETIERTRPRPDSRLELVAEPSADLDPMAFEAASRACVASFED